MAKSISAATPARYAGNVIAGSDHSLACAKLSERRERRIIRLRSKRKGRGG